MTTLAPLSVSMEQHSAASSFPTFHNASAAHAASAAPAAPAVPAASAASHAPSSRAEVPTPKNLEELCTMLHAELDGEGLDSANVDVERVQKLMALYQSNPADWERFALFDGQRYTRNLVDNGNGKFNLMILCWGAGQASPIHDHANSHCLVKVLSGAITETQYEWPSNSDAPVLDSHGDISPTSGLPIKSHATHSLNSVTYMHDKIGLHKVANPSSEIGAVSLHLYTPPIEYCKTFCERTGASRPSGKCVFYSDRGQRCSTIDDIRNAMVRK